MYSTCFKTTIFIFMLHLIYIPQRKTQFVLLVEIMHRVQTKIAIRYFLRKFYQFNSGSTFFIVKLRPFTNRLAHSNRISRRVRTAFSAHNLRSCIYSCVLALRPKLLINLNSCRSKKRLLFSSPLKCPRSNHRYTALNKGTYAFPEVAIRMGCILIAAHDFLLLQLDCVEIYSLYLPLIVAVTNLCCSRIGYVTTVVAAMRNGV